MRLRPPGHRRPNAARGLGLALLVATACDTDEGEAFVPPTATTLANAGLEPIVGTWIQSTEESSGEGEVYRPEGSQMFPPLRFRGSIRFDEGGTCERMVLDPADAHYSEACSWRVLVDEPPRVRVFGESTNVAVIEVLEVSTDILRFTTQTGDLHAEPAQPVAPAGGGGGW